MASTITVAQSINYAQSFGGFKPLSIGTAGEPAITAANTLVQTITSPPFSFNWNRASVSFFTTVGAQDYTVSVPTFGFIEKAGYVLGAQITSTSLTSNGANYAANNNFSVGDLVTVIGTTNGGGVFNVVQQPISFVNPQGFSVVITHGDVSDAADTGAATVGPVSEISQILNILGSGNELGTPTMIAAQTDDGAGNIGFRILPACDRIYQVTVIFQKKQPALITTTAGNFAPVPDKVSYVYQYGFTALMMAYMGDARWTSWNQKFVASLLALADGLSDDQRESFQQAWLASITDASSQQMKKQQGNQARGSL